MQLTADYTIRIYVYAMNSNDDSFESLVSPLFSKITFLFFPGGQFYRIEEIYSR